MNIKHHTKYDQSRKLPIENDGACYGMCRIILELDGRKLESAKTATEVAEALKERIKSKNFINYSVRAQKNRRQDNRGAANTPLEKNRCYILGINIDMTSFGYFTKFSLLSYLNRNTYKSNHAVFLIGKDDGIVLFEPNKGIYIYEGEDITMCSYRNIENMLEQTTYSRKENIYLAEIETEPKRKATNAPSYFSSIFFGKNKYNAPSI